MAIRAVLFDIGGVLEITPETGWMARREAELGVSLGEIFGRLDGLGLNGALGPCSEAEWLAGLAHVSGLSQGQIDGIMGDLWAEYLGTLDQALFNYFAGLRPRYKTGIISNSFVGAREREQALYRFEDVTDDIVYSHEVGMAKPDPRIYQLACQRLGIAPGDAVFVDNRDEMLAPARALGMMTVLHEGDAGRTIERIEEVIGG